MSGFLYSMVQELSTRLRVVSFVTSRDCIVCLYVNMLQFIHSFRSRWTFGWSESVGRSEQYCCENSRPCLLVNYTQVAAARTHNIGADGLRQGHPERLC